MKSLVRIGLALALVATLMVKPNPAEAGLAEVGVGSVLIFTGAGSSERNLDTTRVGIMTLIFGVFGILGPFGWVGIVLDEDSTTISLKTLDANEAEALGLTNHQQASFNSNVDVFNAIAEEIEVTLGKDASYEEIHSAWDYFLGELQVNQEARSALTTVVDHLAGQLESANIQ